MKRRVLILEDLVSCRKALVSMVAECDPDMIIYDFGESADAYQCAMENKIDLFLIDIVLKPQQSNDYSGITFAQSIRKNSEYANAEIVFITTLAGLEAQMLKMVHCFDYIEKPISKERVQKMIREVLCKIDRTPRTNEMIFLRKDRVTYPVQTRKIISIESRKKTLYVNTVDDVIDIPNLSIRKVIDQIHTQEFIYPSKGVAINIEHMEYVDMTNRFVKMRGVDSLIDIGERMKTKFTEELYKYGDVDVR